MHLEEILPNCKVPNCWMWDFHIFYIIKQILIVTLISFKWVCYINIHPQNCCLHQAVNMFSSAVMLTWCFAVTDSSGCPRKLSFLVPSLIFYHLGGTLRCSTELRVMIDWLLRLKMYSVSLLCINLERRWEKQATRHHLLTRRSRLLGCMRLKTNFYSIQLIDVTYSFTEASWPYGGCSSETLPPPSVSPPRAPALAEKRQLGSNTFLRGLHQ